MLKANDLEILKHLRTNADYTLSHLSKLTGIASSTLHDHIMGLKRDGVIERFSIITNLKKLGFNHRYLVIASNEGVNQGKVQDFLNTHQSVSTVLETSDDEFVIEACFRELGEFMQFKHELEHQKNMVMKCIIQIKDDVKREGVAIRK